MQTNEASAPYRTQANKESHSGAGFRAFLRLADLWNLSNEEQRILLGQIKRSTFFKWKKQNGVGVELSHDTLERISYLLGIYKALNIIFPDPAIADAWIRQPNQAPLFGGRSALERMLSGQVSDLFLVRQYLDAERGGWG